MNDQTTEQQFFAEYDQTKAALKAAQQEIALLSSQLRDANTEQEKLAFKCDFLTKEVARAISSREQYERIAIRITAIMEGSITAQIATFEGMQNEIRDAAFTKVPGTPKPAPEPDELAGVDITQIAEKFGAGFDGQQTPLPAQPRFGSGPN